MPEHTSKTKRRLPYDPPSYPLANVLGRLASVESPARSGQHVTRLLGNLASFARVNRPESRQWKRGVGHSSDQPVFPLPGGVDSKVNRQPSDKGPSRAGWSTAPAGPSWLLRIGALARGEAVQVNGVQALINSKRLNGPDRRSRNSGHDGAQQPVPNISRYSVTLDSHFIQRPQSPAKAFSATAAADVKPKDPISSVGFSGSSLRTGGLPLPDYQIAWSPTRMFRASDDDLGHRRQFGAPVSNVMAPLGSAAPQTRTYSAESQAPTAPLISHAASSDGSATAGTLYLDGSVLGRWVSSHVERELTRPNPGTTALDGRIIAPWPGPPITY